MKRQNKLGTYLAVTAGAGCAASVAEGAVTFYGVDAANDTNPDPAAIQLGVISPFMGLNDYVVDATGSGASVFAMHSLASPFTGGSDLVYSSSAPDGRYASYAIFSYTVSPTSGVSFNSDQNYASISFDGSDGIYEAVGQFYFDGAGGGYLVAIATNDAPNAADALSISAGKALIDAAAVPEPSSLALLALGSAGLIARRRRKPA